MSPTLSSPFLTAPRVAVSALLFTAAVLTGCNNSPESAAVDNLPSLLRASRSSGEPVETLGANYTLPPDSRHHSRPHDKPDQSEPRTSHRSL